MITPDFIYLYLNDPRKIENANFTRNLRESLITLMILDKDAAQSQFIAEVPAPADPVVTAYLKKYCKRVKNILTFDGYITDEKIKEIKQRTYKDLEIAKSFDSVEEKSAKYEEYIATLLANRKIISKEDLRFANDVQYGVRTIAENYLILDGILRERQLGDTAMIPEMDFLFRDTGAVPEYNHGHFVMSKLNKYEASLTTLGTRFTIPVDHVVFDAREKKITLTNFKLIPCKITEIKSQAEDLFWADVAMLHHLGEYMKAQNKYTVQIQFIVVDSQGYETLVMFSEEKSAQYFKKFKTLFETKHFRAAALHMTCRTYSHITTPIKI